MSRQTEWIRDDIIKRHTCIAREFNFLLLRGLVINKYTPARIRTKASLNKNMHIAHFAKTQQRNKCRLSGRSYYVIAAVRLSRMPFKYIAGCGLLNGIARSGF